MEAPDKSAPERHAMAKTIRRTTRYDTTPEALLETMLSPETLRQRHLAQGVVKAEVRELSRDESRLVQQVDCQEYVRTKTGGQDRSRTEPTSSRYEWDLRAKRCTWRYDGPESKRIHVGGSFEILPSGQAAELLMTVDVRVDIPLLGRVIEGFIVSDIEKFLDGYRAPVTSKGS